MTVQRPEATTAPTQALRIGPLTLPSRVFLAPMAGITDLPFRRLARRYGAGLTVSEMVASETLNTRAMLTCLALNSFQRTNASIFAFSFGSIL